jgi:hypothetical protein
MDALRGSASDWLFAHPLFYIAVGFLMLPIAFWPMRWMLWHLRLASNIPAEREDKDVGVPPFIGGTFERLLAFSLALFAVQHALTLLAFWLGAKLAASWQRFPESREVRVGTFIALMAGVVSVAIGYFAGALVRHAICQASDIIAKAVIHCTVPVPW